jgi:hypothetical protein
MSSSRRLLALSWLALVGGAGCADLERGDPLPDAAAAADTGVVAGDGAAAVDGAAARTFARDVFPLLVDRCGRCHSNGGQAGDTDLVLGNDAAVGLVQVQKLIDLADPPASRLLTKGSGSGHGGGAAVAAGSPEYTVILEWISQGGAP